MVKEGIREKNYTNILDKAKKLFISQGIKNTTLTQIALQAGVVKKTILNIFTSKNNLVFICAEAVWDDFYKLLENEISSKIFQEKNGLEQVMAIQVFRAKNYYAHPMYADLIMEIEAIECKNEEEWESSTRYLKKSEYLFSYFKDALKKGTEDGSITLHMSVDEAFTFLLLWFGAIAQRLCHIQKNERLARSINVYNIMSNTLKQMRHFLQAHDNDVHQEDEI